MSMSFDSTLILLLLVCFCMANGLRMPRGGISLSLLRSTSKLEATTVKDSAKESGLGWDSHQAIDKIPETLVNAIEGNDSMRRKFEEVCRNAQASICAAIEEIDGGGKFQSDAWVRENGGGGVSRVLQGGKVFEKAGVNLSVVYGTMPQEALRAATERGVDRAKGMKPGERVPFCLWIELCHAPEESICPNYAL